MRAGQACGATTRLLVQEGIHERFLDRVVASISSKGGVTKEQARTAVKSVMDAIKTIREEQKTQKGRVEKVADTAMEMTGLSRSEAESTRSKIENYLRNTHKDELNPEGIKQDLDKLISDPKAGINALKERISHFDRSTVTALLAQRKDMTQEEAQRTVDRFMNTFNDYLNKIEERMGITVKEGESRMKQIEDKLQHFFDSLGKPELHYEDIKHDVEQLLHDPRAGAESLLNRLKAIDRDTIKKMLAQRKDISPEDAERIVSQVEAARDAVIDQTNKVREEVQQGLDKVREISIKQVEEAANTAATASWWAFVTAIVSGFAAVLGGIMPILT
jgi:nucleoid DNA-binding protein